MPQDPSISPGLVDRLRRSAHDLRLIRDLLPNRDGYAEQVLGSSIEAMRDFARVLSQYRFEIPGDAPSDSFWSPALPKIVDGSVYFWYFGPTSHSRQRKAPQLTIAFPVWEDRTWGFLGTTVEFSKEEMIEGGALFGAPIPVPVPPQRG
jgi:hypothetical protein